MHLTAIGRHPAGFVPGAAHVCLIAYVGKGGLYSLFETCAYPALR
jgi:hypothetical protein